MAIPKGYIDTGTTVPCVACSGGGFTYVAQDDGSKIAVQCPVCNGSGSMPLLVKG